MIKKIFFLVIFLFGSLIPTQSQSLLYKIPIEEQIDVSDIIVEGEVVSKQAYFSEKNNRIYTINKVKVYRLFKGSTTQEYINVVTRGGSIGFKKEEMAPNIQLDIGDLGVFMLQNDTNSFVDYESEIEKYRVYSSLQGFYRYDKYKNTAINPYYKFTGIQSSFYQKLEEITAINTEIFDYQFPFERQAKTLATNLAITSFSPMEIRSGIGSPITIRGTDFGNEIGEVIFKNADTGGFTDRSAFDSAIRSWSDTEIIVEVPSFAGTGNIQVLTSNGEIIDSFEELIVLSSELNAEFGAIPGEEFRTKLFNSDNQGGYTWTYNEDFYQNTAAVESFERAIDEWVCETGVSWLINENQSSIKGTREDDFNIVSFISGFESNEDEISPGVLAVTSTYYIGCPNGDGNGGVISYVAEVDMTFNSDFNWFFGEDVNNIGIGVNDFQGTATHELGHAHNLGHVIAPTNLMHFETSSGVESATREIDENSSQGAALNFEYSKIEDLCLPRFVTDRDCLDRSKIEIESIASIENPVTNSLIVRVRDLEAQSYTIHLYSIAGREQFVSVVDVKDAAIDVSSLSTGVYIAKIVINTSIYVQKIIIE